MRIRDVLKWGAIYYASLLAFSWFMNSSLVNQTSTFWTVLLVIGIIIYGIPCLFIVPPLMMAKIVSIRQRRLMGGS